MTEYDLAPDLTWQDQDAEDLTLAFAHSLMMLGLDVPEIAPALRRAAAILEAGEPVH